MGGNHGPVVKGDFEFESRQMYKVDISRIILMQQMYYLFEIFEIKQTEADDSAKKIVVRIALAQLEDRGFEPVWPDSLLNFLNLANY